MPVDSIEPWELPGIPKLLGTQDGSELGMMTQVDADPENNTVVVMIENSGEAPLEIDPLQFTESNWDYFHGLIEPRPDPDLSPVQALWTMDPDLDRAPCLPGPGPASRSNFRSHSSPDRARAIFCTGTTGSSMARSRSSVWIIVGMEVARLARDCDSVASRKTNFRGSR